MLKLLLKTRFLALADQFSGQSKGKRAISVRRIVLLAVAALLLLALAGYVVSLLLTPLYKTLLKSDLEWLYFARSCPCRSGLPPFSAAGSARCIS